MCISKALPSQQGISIRWLIKCSTFFLWVLPKSLKLCVLHSQHISVWTGHISSAQWQLLYLECLFFPSIDVLGYPTYGVPTIRSDIPAPLIRRVSDRTSYGEEGNAYSLLHPTIFAQKGVFERDFFKTRSKQEVPHGISKGLKERPTLHWHTKMERFICLSFCIIKVIRSPSD